MRIPKNTEKKKKKFEYLLKELNSIKSNPNKIKNKEKSIPFISNKKKNTKITSSTKLKKKHNFGSEKIHLNIIYKKYNPLDPSNPRIERISSMKQNPKKKDKSKKKFKIQNSKSVKSQNSNKKKVCKNLKNSKIYHNKQNFHNSRFSVYTENAKNGVSFTERTELTDFGTSCTDEDFKIKFTTARNSHFNYSGKSINSELIDLYNGKINKTLGFSKNSESKKIFKKKDNLDLQKNGKTFFGNNDMIIYKNTKDLSYNNNNIVYDKNFASNNNKKYYKKNNNEISSEKNFYIHRESINSINSNNFGSSINLENNYFFNPNGKIKIKKIKSYEEQPSLHLIKYFKNKNNGINVSKNSNFQKIDQKKNCLNYQNLGSSNNFKFKKDF